MEGRGIMGKRPESAAVTELFVLQPKELQHYGTVVQVPSGSKRSAA
jgi:hypothetical protein